MTGRDYSRVVLAEDNTERAQEMMTFLAGVGEYDVKITKWRAQVDNYLETTNAGWLILDLELEDGNSSEIVPLLREKYGKDLIILVLSGYYETYTEQSLLAMGADYYFKKPYSSNALLQQMAVIRDRIEGWETQTTSGIILKTSKGTIDVERGIYKEGGKEVSIPYTQIKLLEVLAKARDEKGWKYVDRPRLNLLIYGEEVIDSTTLADKLRLIRFRLRKTIGEEIIDVHRGGPSKHPSFKLKDEVKIYEE